MHQQCNSWHLCPYCSLQCIYHNIAMPLQIKCSHIVKMLKAYLKWKINPSLCKKCTWILLKDKKYRRLQFTHVLKMYKAQINTPTWSIYTIISFSSKSSKWPPKSFMFVVVFLVSYSIYTVALTAQRSIRIKLI